MQPVDIVIHPAAGWNESFSTALTQIKAGARAARVGWNCNETWIYLDGEDIRKRYQDGTSLSWMPSHQDLLANDWHVI